MEGELTVRLSGKTHLLPYIDRAREGSGRILVHCLAGVSRSAAIVVAYLHLACGMDVTAAYDMIKSKRPCVSPNLSFMAQLSKLGAAGRRSNFLLASLARAEPDSPRAEMEPSRQRPVDTCASGEARLGARVEPKECMPGSPLPPGPLGQGASKLDSPSSVDTVSTLSWHSGEILVPAHHLEHCLPPPPPMEGSVPGKSPMVCD